MRALVLLSGGLDSTVALYWAISRYGLDNVHALTIMYGQRNRPEFDAALWIARRANIASHEILDLGPNLFRGSSPLTNHAIPVAQYDSIDDQPAGVDQSFVPGRNIVFYAIAANRAAVLNCQRIVSGTALSGQAGYPDCRLDFLSAMDSALQLGILDSDDTEYQDRTGLSTPLVCLSKAEIIGKAATLPGCLDALAYSYSCYVGKEQPCGHCHACLGRAQGFREAGIEDPYLIRIQAS